MEKPSLEEVRAHFKGAKIVEDNYGDTYTYLGSKVFYNRGGDCWCIKIEKDGFNLVLWESQHGYAKILEYENKHSTVDRAIEEVVMSNKDEVIGNIPPSRRVTLTDTGAFTDFKLDFDFDQTIESTLNHLKELLTVKGKEYRRNGNVFHNFDEGAKITGKLREEVLHGFRLKHEISVNDMRNDLAQEGKLPTKEKIEEKYNDILVYYLIEKASMLDRIDNQKE